MRNPGGTAVICSPDEHRVNFNGRWETLPAGVVERDGFTCFHCQEIEHTPVKPGANDIGLCRHCMRRICQKCSGLPCMPFQAKLHALENGIKDALRRDFYSEEWFRK
jgi:hypothetical protein